MVIINKCDVNILFTFTTKINIAQVNKLFL